MIVSSTFTEGAQQVDGRRYVRERHTTDAGEVIEFEWLGSEPAQAVVDARAAELTRQLAERAEAEARIAGTLLPLTKLQFRELFTTAERQGIDALHAGFESHPVLTAEQKAAIRTGLEDYRMAQNVRRPFDARVSQMLGMYQALGLVTAERVAAILAAGE